MLRVATVFSGIGAPEEALKQMNIEYEIVFACDNGERYSDEIDVRIEEIRQKEPGISFQNAAKKAYDSTKIPNNVKKTYFANYDISEEQWHEDIRYLDGTEFSRKVDILIGGSPCQAFSTYGKRKGLEDTRGTLFYDYARLIQEIQPKAFIFENVTGLLNHDNGRTWDVIRYTFEKTLEYEIEMAVLNAKDFNLPQLRRRVFVVGLKKELNLPKFRFPEPVALTHKSFEYLEESVPEKYYLGKKGFEFVTDPLRNERRARVNQDVIGCQTANQQFNWVGDFRVEPPKPEFIENSNIYIGTFQGRPAVARKLTPRETHRLMGFSDNFKIVTPDKVAWRQCGNSIAVPVIKAILEEIIKMIGV